VYKEKKTCIENNEQKLYLKKSNVNERVVRVDQLEQEVFKYKGVVVLSL
jgi:hypothetical protein